ncbi:hypothetical protein ABXT70_02365 [Candidatus Njordibacter sp. Uisw_039]|uniref:hypothetical protein n=1 Tax=Candidatus Njordibacter sp. Uisw_039 TaxID=3230972 RepID=UPI003D503138
MDDKRFDWFPVLKSSALEPLIEELSCYAIKTYVGKELSSRGANPAKRNMDLRSIATHFISALYQAQIRVAGNQYKVSVPRGKGDYDKKDRGIQTDSKIRYSYNYVTRVFECLKSLGWVDVTDHEVRIHHTLMHPAGRLAKVFKEVGYVWQPAVQLPGESLVRLSDAVRDENNRPKRNKKGVTKTKPLEFKETDSIKMHRSVLYGINSYLVRHCITLALSDRELAELEEEQAKNEEHKKYRCVDFFQTQLVRSFSRGSFDKGGRFYRGWWQNILSGYRRYILIDGVRTVEVDFCNMSLRMLYAQSNIEYPDDLDAYDFGLDNWKKKDDPRRGVIKEFVNALLNDEDKVYKLKAKDKKVLGGLDHDHMMNLLKQTHPLIFDKILAGGGQFIQNLDSQIAQQILLILLRENITCLPIHDSFIVQYQHADRLVEVMETVFLEKLGKRGVVERTEGKLNRELDDDSIMGKFLQSWKDHDLGER